MGGVWGVRGGGYKSVIAPGILGKKINYIAFLTRLKISFTVCETITRIKGVTVSDVRPSRPQIFKKTISSQMPASTTCPTSEAEEAI